MKWEELILTMNGLTEDIKRKQKNMEVLEKETEKLRIENYQLREELLKTKKDLQDWRNIALEQKK